MRASFSFTQSLSRNTMRFEGHRHAPPSSLQRNARHSFRKGGGRLPTCSAYISPREPIARPKLSRRRKQCTEQLRCIGLGGLSTINWQHFLSPRCSTLIPDGESCANAFASAWANSGVQCAPTSCRRSLTFEQWPRPFRVRGHAFLGLLGIRSAACVPRQSKLRTTPGAAHDQWPYLEPKCDVLQPI